MINTINNDINDVTCMTCSICWDVCGLRVMFVGCLFGKMNQKINNPNDLPFFKVVFCIFFIFGCLSANKNVIYTLHSNLIGQEEYNCFINRPFQ